MIDQPAPTDCDHCRRALAGMWCGYVAGCDGCTARAIARSLNAFHALHPRGNGDRNALRDLIRRAMPTTDYTSARARVWAWWRHDHSDKQKPSADT